MEFKDDADSILLENLLASVSQHQRRKNAEQTRNRMRGRSIELARAMFKDAWNQRLAQAVEIARSAKREAAKIDKQIESLLDRIVETGSRTVVAAYEKRIAALERQRAVLHEKSEKGAPRQGTFEELFELAIRFLGNPGKLWHSEQIEHQKPVLRLTFADRLAYSRNSGFRTPKTTLPFKLLEDFRMGESEMAERESAKLSASSVRCCPDFLYISRGIGPTQAVNVRRCSLQSGLNARVNAGVLVKWDARATG
jgi:hypothetical protein